MNIPLVEKATADGDTAVGAAVVGAATVGEAAVREAAAQAAAAEAELAYTTTNENNKKGILSKCLSCFCRGSNEREGGGSTVEAETAGEGGGGVGGRGGTFDNQTFSTKKENASSPSGQSTDENIHYPHEKPKLYVQFNTTLFALVRESLCIKMMPCNKSDWTGNLAVDRRLATLELRRIVRRCWPFHSKTMLNVVVPTEEQTDGMTIAKLYIGKIVAENWRRFLEEKRTTESRLGGGGGGGGEGGEGNRKDKEREERGSEKGGADSGEVSGGDESHPIEGDVDGKHG